MEDEYVEHSELRGALTFPPHDLYTTGPDSSSRLPRVTVQRSDEGVYTLAGSNEGVYDLSRGSLNTLKQEEIGEANCCVTHKTKIIAGLTLCIIIGIGLGAGIAIGIQKGKIVETYIYPTTAKSTAVGPRAMFGDYKGMCSLGIIISNYFRLLLVQVA